MRPMLTGLLSALTLAAALPVAAQAQTPADFAAAVASPSRPADARKLDESRKPAEVLAFLGLKAGDKAADIMTGSGYWAEIMAAVTGPTGKVTGYEPQQFYSTPEELKIWDALVARVPSVEWKRYPFEAFAAAPDSLDFTIINLSYHDLYWQSEKYKIPRTDPDAFLTALYRATKKGGVVGVIDHVGLPGDTRATVDSVHRIDPAVVKADFERAGFTLAASSAMLANPADDHAKLVFDPAIRGKTDRFVYKFVKE